MEDALRNSKRVGSVVRGKWTLERLIGVGGMAAVYVGRHKIGRTDAIKILHPDYAGTPEVRARFEQEALALNRFRHPGAVDVRDIDISENGEPFLVMELLDGESLSKVARARDLEVPEVLRIADETLDVLAAAHAEGVIHRDIKPDNLFLLRDGRVKVLDFGIARLRSGAQMKTKAGIALGTVSYMPPEQARGAEVDIRADVYAVGATMFRLLAKRRVHEAETDAELVMKVVSEPAPRLASIAPGVPEGVCMVTDRALAFDRAARYPDARTMQADVRAVVRGDAPPFAKSAPAFLEPKPADEPRSIPLAGGGVRDAPTVGPRRDLPTAAASPAAARAAPPPGATGAAPPTRIGPETPPTVAAAPLASAFGDGTFGIARLPAAWVVGCGALLAAALLAGGLAVAAALLWPSDVRPVAPLLPASTPPPPAASATSEPPLLPPATRPHGHGNKHKD